MEISASSPLPQVLAQQVGDTELGDHVVYIGAVGDDPGAGFQHGDDAGKVLGGRRKRDDRLAVFRRRCPTDEVHLASETGVDPGPDRIGADLPGEVDLDGRIDGDQLSFWAITKGSFT